MDILKLENKIFDIQSDSDFDDVSLQVFDFQYHSIKVYQEFCDLLNRNPQNIESYLDIPFLPIGFFKNNKIIADNYTPEIIFESSGTTGSETSKHYLAKTELYKKSFLNCFRQFYGNPNDYCIVGLLPSYLERGNSSLVYMVNELIGLSGNEQSGFYLNNYKELAELLLINEGNKQKTLVFGVPYALLDMAESFPMKLSYTTIIETGGMKGRRKELIREELHEILKRGFGVNQIHSEYGMTELLSQAYLTEDNMFQSPNWMKVVIREVESPLMLLEEGKIGGINIIDLANLYSCSFIATQDLGKSHTNNTFEVLGRFDNSDIRGCNLLVS